NPENSDHNTKLHSLPTINLSTPYITGFEFARQSNPGEISLTILWKPSTHIYMHPDLALADRATAQDREEENVVLSERRYTQAHDLYSLCLVLTQTGLLQPLSNHLRIV